jgi:hypothetical protein
VKAEKILIPHYGEIQIPWPDCIDADIRALETARERITEMFREKRGFPQMVERLRADIIRDSSRNEEEIPAFLSRVYLREMVKAGLMGFIAYFLEYAPYPRAFSNGAGGKGMA